MREHGADLRALVDRVGVEATAARGLVEEILDDYEALYDGAHGARSDETVRSIAEQARERALLAIALYAALQDDELGDPAGQLSLSLSVLALARDQGELALELLVDPDLLRTELS